MGATRPKQSLKNDAAEAMLQRVEIALMVARSAVADAAERWVKAAPRNPDGSVAYTNCGFALVYASRMKPRLRHALRILGEIEYGHRGIWPLENIPGPVSTPGFDCQSAQANSMICGAAAAALNNQLGDVGYFGTQFRDD